MATAGSILLITGIAGIIVILGLLTYRPRIFSRGVTVGLLTGFMLLAGAGLVMLTAATGGESLHTGG
ncbi:MAG: hypothetical protein ACYC4D_01265 [Thermoleophilia bacterium]